MKRSLINPVQERARILRKATSSAHICLKKNTICILIISSDALDWRDSAKAYNQFPSLFSIHPRHNASTPAFILCAINTTRLVFPLAGRSSSTSLLLPRLDSSQWLRSMRAQRQRQPRLSVLQCQRALSDQRPMFLSTSRRRLPRGLHR